MKNEGPVVSSFGVEKQGITGVQTAYWNLPPARLVELAVKRGEAVLAAEGPIVAETGAHTGRSPNDKFLVKDPAIDGDIWWGDVNRPFEREKFDALLARAQDYLKGKDIFVEQAHEDLYAAVDQLMDKLDRQVVRYKDRLQDHHHATGKRQVAPEMPLPT